MLDRDFAEVKLFETVILHNVCAGHRGCTVHWRTFSTPGGYHEYNAGNTMIDVEKVIEKTTALITHPLVYS